MSKEYFSDPVHAEIIKDLRLDESIEMPAVPAADSGVRYSEYDIKRRAIKSYLTQYLVDIADMRLGRFANKLPDDQLSAEARRFMGDMDITSATIAVSNAIAELKIHNVMVDMEFVQRMLEKTGMSDGFGLDTHDPDGRAYIDLFALADVLQSRYFQQRLIQNSFGRPHVEFLSDNVHFRVSTETGYYTDPRQVDAACLAFAGVDLTGGKFSNCIFPDGMRFRAASINNVRFIGSRLRNAYFHAVFLSDFDEADIRNAKFTNYIANTSFLRSFGQGMLVFDADIENVDFSDANLDESIFMKCKIENSRFDRVDMSQAYLIRNTFAGLSSFVGSQISDGGF